MARPKRGRRGEEEDTFKSRLIKLLQTGIFCPIFDFFSKKITLFHTAAIKTATRRYYGRNFKSINMYQPKQHTGALRFRRFCRAGWAAFSSMHREVTIGRLAVRVADNSLCKVAVCCLLTAVGSPLMAQTDDDREVRTLPEVEVLLASDSLGSASEPAAVLTADDLQQHNIRTLADLMALLPGVDFRVRGVGDAQGDLSLRGGTFDQTLLLLNGINLTDPQTGHHTMDIPLDISMVQRVELLTPAQCLARGVVAFCGAVNIVVCDDYRDRLMADLSIGMHGTAKASLLATKALGDWALTTAATYSRSDGYMPNTDYRHGSLLLQARRQGWHLQLGGQLKGFGSQAFYSTAYPDQYEATRTLVASVSNHFQLSTFRFQLSTYLRLHGDRFELFREGYVDSVPAWYAGHNHHLSSLGGLRLRATRPLPVGELIAGAEVRREGIRSNVLGLPDSTLAPPYTRADSRLNTSLFGGYALRRGRFSAQAVALGLYNSRFGFDYGLAANADYQLPTFNLQLSASRTFRQPTFTDLYYQGPSQQANPDLGPEASTNLELALRGKISIFNFQFSIYHRAGVDIIGWVRPTEEDLWLSMNHTAVDATGLDAAARFQFSIFNFQLNYSFCHIAADSHGLLSSSALDHLRHRLAARMDFAISSFHFKLGAAYRYREGQYVADGQRHDYGGVLLVDAGVERAFGSATLYLQAYNLLNASYHDYGGVPQPGITATAGLRLGL